MCPNGKFLSIFTFFMMRLYSKTMDRDILSILTLTRQRRAQWRQGKQDWGRKKQRNSTGQRLRTNKSSCKASNPQRYKPFYLSLYLFCLFSDNITRNFLLNRISTKFHLRQFRSEQWRICIEMKQNKDTNRLPNKLLRMRFILRI